MTSPSASSSPDLIADIREQAEALVRRVNPGCDYAGAWFAPKVAEVAEVIVRRVCLGNVAEGRAGLARKIRLAWEASELERFRGLRRQARDARERGDYPAAVSLYGQAAALLPEGHSARDGIAETVRRLEAHAAELEQGA